MRMLMTVTLPTEIANEHVRKGSLGSAIAKILEEAKPESVYFGTLGTGERSGMIVVDLKEASDIVKYSEPWFVTFGASVNFEPVMTPADLEAAAPHLKRAAQY
jgi:hypothetical protein